MMGHLYRDPSDGLGQLRAELYRERLAELEALPPCLRRIYSRRVARTAAGVAGFIGMSAVFLLALIAVLDKPVEVTSLTARGLGLTTVSVWGITALTYLIARLVASWVFSSRARGLLEVTGEVHRDVDLLSVPLASRVARLVARYERASVAWPLLGAAMVMPLLLHWMVYAVHLGALPKTADFGFWIALSAVTVGHCHLVLAYCAWRFARDLQGSDLESMNEIDTRGFRALGLTTSSSLFPGLVLVGIPCILVGLTGLVFVPAAFWTVAGRVRAERFLLAGPSPQD